MIRRPDRRQQSSLFERERPPRLVLRFALVLSLSLALASAAILVVVRIHAVSQAENAAIKHASLIASTLLQRDLRATDLVGPVSAGRREALDALFERHLLGTDTLAVSIVRSDRVVTYSTDAGAIGTRASAPLVSTASGGSIVSTVSRASARGNATGTKTLETYAPVGTGSRRGAVVIVQDYAPIEDAARTAQLHVGAVLEGLLLALVLVFVPLLGRVTRRINRQVDEIHFRAFYDGLTRLPNRAHLIEHLGLALIQAAEAQTQVAVLQLDLDRFRDINDTLGYESGDALLVETADRLRRAAASGALVAHLGEDEFAVVIECASGGEAIEHAEELRAAIAPQFVAGSVPLAVDATVGVARFPTDGEDADTLLRRAEVALYAAKELRVGVLAYDPAIDAHDTAQLSLMAELRGAADRGELVVHYQPKISLSTGSVIGFEALVRWKHPKRGLLAPGAFVPLAERTGAIRHISRAVLASVARQLREWESIDSELTVAVNLTAIDLLDLEFPAYLEGLLREHDVQPDRLCVEITESTVMADPARAKSTLDRLVSTGVRVSIDDFGTGHSSLAYLKELPVHEVKIDQSFVAGIDVSKADRVIVRATIQLAQGLGLTVVAEGVETVEVDELLREMGCDQAQGYLYARPQPAELIPVSWLDKSREAA